MVRQYKNSIKLHKALRSGLRFSKNIAGKPRIGGKAAMVGLGIAGIAGAGMLAHKLYKENRKKQDIKRVRNEGASFVRKAMAGVALGTLGLAVNAQLGGGHLIKSVPNYDASKMTGKSEPRRNVKYIRRTGTKGAYRYVYPK